MPNFDILLDQAVPPPHDVPVRLIVGSEESLVTVSRSTRFDRLTLVGSDRMSFPPERGSRKIIDRSVRRLPSVELPRYFDTRAWEPNNISHLLLDVIPLCLLARRALPDTTFVFRPMTERFLELVSTFGIEPVCTMRRTNGFGIQAFVSRELAQYELGTVFDCPNYSLTGEVYDTETESGSSKLFLARRGNRALLNQQEVTSFLESRGYDAVYLEDFPIAEQIRIFRAARHVVAIHGAALGYLALTKAVESVVELLPPNVYHNIFPVAVGHKAGRWTQLIPSFDRNVHFAGWPEISRHKEAPFAIDLGQLEAALA